MNTTIIVLLGILIVAVMFGLYIVGALLDRDTKSREHEFETKMAMAEAQSKSMSVKSFEELRSTLDYFISFYTAHEVIMIVNNQLKDDDKGEILKECTVEISALVRESLSPEFKRQLSCYMVLSDNDKEEDFLDYYIRKTALTMVTRTIESQRPSQH